jgi:two-component system chemotaxis sensor kinase CheA
LLAKIESTGSEGEEQYAELGARLTAALPGVRDVAAAGSAPAPAASAAPARTEISSPVPAASAATSSPAGRPPASLPHRAEERAPQQEGGEGPVSPDAVIHREVSVRLGVGLLDRLMNLVGELVLARNQVLQRSAESPDASLVAAAQRLSLITSELQEGIMKTRMQPISAVWSKFPRVVRDLAIACGKRVQLELSGEDTELDRSVLEAIRDPLIHIVRNSVDHGLETAEERRAAQKSETGLIRFRAFHEGGMVNIEVIDDGRGIDPAVVTEKAIERGLIDRARGERLGDWEALHLIFLPGFSTAQALTRVSGRGVGMDVVKTSVERIGGTVDIQSRLGRGTKIHFKIPLTLAIVPALIVTCRGGRYAIPQVNLVELVRLEGPHAVEYVRDAPVHRLRGQLLPLTFLQSVLGGTAPGRNAGDLTMIVLRADNRTFGLVVDDVADSQEIVVKPLGRELSRVPIFAGATIMGDGKVALILDVFGIAERVGIDAS